MRTAVIGAGVVGLSAAYALLRHGSEVICFERGEPMGARSTGSSRIFRLVHADAGLVAYAAAASGMWADWTHRAGTRLVGQQGGVLTGELARQCAEAMEEAGAAYELHEDPDPAELGLPIESLPGPALVDQAAGVIDAVATGRFLRAAIGNRIRHEHIHRIDPADDYVLVHGSDGVHEVDRVVIAAGRGSVDLAEQIGVYLPTELGHHARFTFRLKDPDARPPCWLDRSESWRPGVTSYQQLSAPGQWAIGMEYGAAEVAWERGREEVVAEARELVTDYVREELTGVDDEIVEEVYCDTNPSLGDGVQVVTTGLVTVVWGANLFKHAPAIGQTLANAAVTGTPLARLPGN